MHRAGSSPAPEQSVADNSRPCGSCKSGRHTGQRGAMIGVLTASYATPRTAKEIYEPEANPETTAEGGPEPRTAGAHIFG